jgi:hypothetical protein
LAKVLKHKREYFVVESDGRSAAVQLCASQKLLAIKAVLLFVILIADRNTKFSVDVSDVEPIASVVFYFLTL